MSLTQHLLIYADQKQTPNNTASNEKQQERKEEQFSHGTRRTQQATDPCSTSYHFHMSNLKLIKILTPLWWFSAANKDLKSFFPKLLITNSYYRLFSIILVRLSFWTLGDHYWSCVVSAERHSGPNELLFRELLFGRVNVMTQVIEMVSAVGTDWQTPIIFFFSSARSLFLCECFMGTEAFHVSQAVDHLSIYWPLRCTGASYCLEKPRNIKHNT